MLRSHSFSIDAIVMSFIVFILYALCAVTLNITASEYTINSQEPATLVLHTVCFWKSAMQTSIISVPMSGHCINLLRQSEALCRS